MVSFENVVKSMRPSLSELKVIPSFCFAFKIPDNVTATNTNMYNSVLNMLVVEFNLVKNLNPTAAIIISIPQIVS